MSDDCIDDVGVTENSTDVTVDEITPIDVTISEETTDLTISCDEITVEAFTQDPITVDLEEEIITVDVTEEAVTITTDCAQGPQGPPGNTLWNDTQTYDIDDIVYYDGNFYLALTINTNSTPDSNPSDWQQISAGGGGAVDSVNTQTGVVVLDTDDIAEGSSNLYYTDTRVRANTLNQLTAPTTDLSLNSNKLTNVDDPTTEQDVATKNYVDTRDWKQSVRLATIAALPTNTYNNGASGIGATITINATGVLTVDGLNVAAGDRILVKNETSTLKHGIYTCTTAGAVGVSAVLTRATDCDEPNNFVGLVVYVRSGTTAIQRVYGYQGSTVPTVGTTGIVITEINRLIYSSGIANNTTTNTVTADETYLQRTMTTTAIKTANYSALAYQYVPVSTASGNVTITLQPVTNGVLVGVSHVTQGGSNTVTISAGSTVFYKFGGPTSIVMPMLNQTMYFQYYGGIWFVLGASYDTTQLDTRYTAIADAKVSDSITDAITTIAPSQNAVFDALALKEDLTNKDTDVTLSANSDTKYPSQKAVKDYIDNLDGLLPIGGDTGQRLQKASVTDYDVEWANDTYSQFIYDSTAVQEQNVYNDWADLVTAVNNGQSGQKTITFRNNGDMLPAGTWNLSNTTFAGNGFPPAAGGVIIDLADGFVFDEVPSLKFESFIAFRSLSTAPIMTINSLTSIFMKENTIFSSTTVPFFEIGPGAFALFAHDNGALFADDGAPVLDLGVSGNVISAVVGGSVDFQPDTVIGGVSSNWKLYVYDDAPSSDIINVSQPSFFGTLDSLKVARADYVSYSNLASGLTAVDVQAAIDEIIPLIPNIPNGTMVDDILVWDGDSWEAEQLIVDAQPTKTTTLFDETTTPGVIYIGKALPTGSAISEAGAVWAIKTIDTTADTEIRWADGVTTYTKVWDDRASYSYL